MASFEPFELIDGDPDSGYLILCDHARNALPEQYGTLGLHHDQLERHIAYDIGARGVTLGLAKRLGAPAVLSTFSRLLIDPNRALNDPTLVMRLSDGAKVPGNALMDLEERQHRIDTYYLPYDNAVAAAIDKAKAAGKPPALISVHSFTPHWKGTPRPWEIGVLWDKDARLPVPLIAALQKDRMLTVGDNEPYSGELPGDTMWRHGTSKGLAHALLEIRQDLIADDAGVENWVNRLVPLFEELRGLEGLNTVRTF